MLSKNFIFHTEIWQNLILRMNGTKSQLMRQKCCRLLCDESECMRLCVCAQTPSHCNQMWVIC
jgi:hypothetical protein